VFSLHRDHHAEGCAASHLAAWLRVRARPDRQPEHQCDPHRSRGDANPEGLGRDPVASIRGTRRAARTPCASRSGSAASAKRGLPFRRCSRISRLKHIFVFDEDIDIRNDLQVEWALGTRFQADQDLMILQGIPGMSMDPSLQGRRTGAKSGFDCTKPFGRSGEIPLTRSAAKSFKGPPASRISSSAGHCTDVLRRPRRVDRQPRRPRDRLRTGRTPANGRLGRDRDGRYHLAPSKPA